MRFSNVTVARFTRDKVLFRAGSKHAQKKKKKKSKSKAYIRKFGNNVM